MDLKFFVCEHCAGVFIGLGDVKAPIECCGQEMKELVAGTTEGAAEKHVPVIRTEDGLVAVCVGSAEHPMLEEHSIKWVCLQTSQGFQYKGLRPGSRPEARFALCDGDEVKAAYAYCDLHGLWKA